MASKSSMALSSMKKTSATLAPYQRPFPKRLSAATCNPDTAVPSCSYARPVSPKNYPSRPSVPTLSSLESVNKELQELLHRKLVHRILTGRVTDSLQYHRHQLVEELTRWIQPSKDIPETFDFTFRDRLITLLAGESKQNLRELPLEESQWIKLLNQWVRNNSSEDIVYSREIYGILAVDGFSGMGPKDLKYYVGQVLLPLRLEYRLHKAGVRAMYDSMDKNTAVQCLTGTHSACVVLLALLQLYTREMEDQLFDDQVSFRVHQVQSWTEGYLHNHSEYYRDIQNVNEELLNSLSQVYKDQFTEEEEWRIVGIDAMKDLSVPVEK